MRRPTPCSRTTAFEARYHPSWDKVYGDPSEPATSIVFGEKGSGKTALRLQIIRHVAEYNRDHPSDRLFVIEYDDFNPFLDRFRDKFSSVRRRRQDQVLSQWKLWDHMDAILSLGVTQLVDRILEVRSGNGRPADAGAVEAVAARSRTRPATCCCWPPVMTNRPPRPSGNAGTGCGENCGFPPGARCGRSPSAC